MASDDVYGRTIEICLKRSDLLTADSHYITSSAESVSHLRTTIAIAITTTATLPHHGQAPRQPATNRPNPPSPRAQSHPPSPSAPPLPPPHTPRPRLFASKDSNHQPKPTSHLPLVPPTSPRPLLCPRPPKTHNQFHPCPPSPSKRRRGEQRR